MWVTGGLPCGKDLYLHYARNEVTLADRGYCYKHFFKHPSNQREKGLLARHETLNGRLKPIEKAPIGFPCAY